MTNEQLLRIRAREQLERVLIYGQGPKHWSDRPSESQLEMIDRLMDEVVEPLLST